VSSQLVASNEPGSRRVVLLYWLTDDWVLITWIVHPERGLASHAGPLCNGALIHWLSIETLDSFPMLGMTAVACDAAVGIAWFVAPYRPEPD
jgi:hypothetical protein